MPTVLLNLNLYILHMCIPLLIHTFMAKLVSSLLVLASIGCLYLQAGSRALCLYSQVVFECMSYETC